MVIVFNFDDYKFAVFMFCSSHDSSYNSFNVSELINGLFNQ